MPGQGDRDGNNPDATVPGMRRCEENNPMTDYLHLKNVIQGAVIQIRERRPLEKQMALLDELVDFLADQIHEVHGTQADVVAALKKALSEAEEESRSDINPEIT